MGAEGVELEEVTDEMKGARSMVSTVSVLNMFDEMKRQLEQISLALATAEQRAQEGDEKVTSLTAENARLQASLEELKLVKSPTEQELFECRMQKKAFEAQVSEMGMERDTLRSMLEAAQQLAGQLDLEREFAQASLNEAEEQNKAELSAQRQLFEAALADRERRAQAELQLRAQQSQEREMALVKTLEDLRNNLQRQIFEQQLQLAGMEIPEQLLEMDGKKEALRETLWLQELELAAIELPRLPDEPLVRFPERIFPQYEPASQSLVLQTPALTKQESSVRQAITTQQEANTTEKPVPKRRRTATHRGPTTVNPTQWPPLLNVDIDDALTVMDESVSPSTPKSKMCTFPGCSKSASYGYTEEKRRTRCKEHRLPDMENVKSRWCSHPGCKTAPTYGFRGDPRSSRCKAHKLEGMLDIVNPRCNAEEGCSKQPSYGFAGDERPTRCKVHREEGMEDIKSRFCSEPGCKTRPLYGFIGDGRPSKCKNHKLEGMEDIMHPRCATLGCKVRPTFGRMGEKRPEVCEAHKTRDMVDFRSFSKGNSAKAKGVAW